MESSTTNGSNRVTAGLMAPSLPDSIIRPVRRVRQRYATAKRNRLSEIAKLRRRIPDKVWILEQAERAVAAAERAVAASEIRLAARRAILAQKRADLTRERSALMLARNDLRDFITKNPEV